MSRANASVALLLTAAAVCTSTSARAEVVPAELPPPTPPEVERVEDKYAISVDMAYATWVGTSHFGEPPKSDTKTPPATTKAAAGAPWGKSVVDWYTPGPIVGASVLARVGEGYFGATLRSASWTPGSGSSQPSHWEGGFSARNLGGSPVGATFAMDAFLLSIRQDVPGGVFALFGGFISLSAGMSFTPKWARSLTLEPHATLGLAILPSPTLDKVDTDGPTMFIPQLRGGLRLTFTQ